MSKEIIIYHGSHNIIEKPKYGLGNKNNDYGLGFYCTYYKELAKEWACDEKESGYCNKYSLDLTGLKVLNLNSNKYNIIHWISLLLQNRKVSLNSDIERIGMNYIIENFKVDVSEYDVIIGYRADDSYFSFARDFLSNTITYEKLNQAMKLGNLGNQIVLKSQKAFDQIRFLEADVASKDTYYPLRKKRDMLARTAYQSNKNNISDINNSLFLIDIIRKGIKENDKDLQ